MDRSLCLLEELVKAFGIRIHCYGADMDGLEDFDDGLRVRIFQENTTRVLTGFLQGMKRGIMYICGDPYGCRYCFSLVPPCASGGNDFQYCIIGPWRESSLKEDDIGIIFKKFNIPDHLKSEVISYLNAVPQIHSPYSWEHILFTGIFYLYGGDITIQISRHEKGVDGPPEAYSPKTETTLTRRLINDRYENEAALLEAVREGNADKALHCIVGFKYSKENLWSEDKLRDGKNHVIVMDTLLRKAVENTYVHPFHIDATSAYFARYIENAVSLPELRRIVDLMIRRYCALVEKFSLRGYSSLIRNVINMVDFNLQKPLSVFSLAKQFNTNRSNLSAQFKREKGIPLTKYINTKRMEYAAFLFRNSGGYIQDVAEQCGFLNVNYFSRLFKQHYGMSPQDFRKENNRR
jgi:AraC-like DNA-binding protein